MRRDDVASTLLRRHFLRYVPAWKAYWLATSGGRVPVVAVCVLHTQLGICCETDLACL